jgi:2-hydroxychromene-2-carboxylate isomerase
MDGALLMCEALEADTQMILTEQQQHAASIGISAAPSYLLDGDIFSGSDGLNRLSQRLMQQ